MSSHPSSMQPFLRTLEARSHLTAAERQAILDLPFVPVQVRPNHDFVRQFEEIGHSTFVLDGVVASFKQDREGNRQIVAIFIDGDMVDLHSVPVPQAASSLQALTPTTILKVPHSVLRQLARDYPNIAEAFWRHCVVDAGILMEWVVNVGRRDAKSRMAHFFCELAWRAAEGEPEERATIPYPITQFQLSDILSLTAVHVNRTLQYLRQLGLIESAERSTHRILDWKGLMKLGDFNPSYLHLNGTSRSIAA